jgi:hypothetical protein
MSQVADISFRRSKIKTAPPLPPAASLFLSFSPYSDDQFDQFDQSKR